MPYKVVKSSKCPANKPYTVVNTETGKSHGCATKADANKQMRLLYGIESGSIKK
jgi:hypothetical protein